MAEDKKKNPEVKEESKEETLQEESKDKKESPKAEQPSKEEPKEVNQEETDDGTSKLKNDFEALKGAVSGKDKQLQSVVKKVSELEQEVARANNISRVKDLLLDFNGPDSVREILKSNLENYTPESFQQEAEKYTSIYNKGVEEQKEAASKFVGQKPEPQAPADFSERVNNAKNEEELSEILAEFG